VERQEVGERETEEQREKSYGGGDAGGAEEDFDIQTILEESGVVGEIPVMEDDAVADGPEAVQNIKR